jgi:hypothetical protein
MDGILALWRSRFFIAIFADPGPAASRIHRKNEGLRVHRDARGSEYWNSQMCHRFNLPRLHLRGIGAQHEHGPA